MSKYSGSEGRILSKEETKNAVATYKEKFSGKSHYTKYEVIGKEIIDQVLVDNAVAIRVYNGIGDDGQTGVYLVPVSKDGVELAFVF